MGSNKPYTTAVFEINGEQYHGCATFDRESNYKPWYAWLVHNGDYYMTLGDFHTIHDAWGRARDVLGLPEIPPLLTRLGEGTDGGPFSGNDSTHVR